MENLDLLPKWDWAQKTSFLNELPKIDKLPECEFDPKYTFSFDCSDLSIIPEREIRDFFDEYGFVVLRNVFTKEDCQKTRNAMWEILESGNPQLKRDDYKTWNQLKGKGQYGLSIRGPSFHPQLVSNRQNPKLVQALTILTQASSTNNLIVSQDRFTVYRATQFDDETIPGESFSTGDRNLHLDMNPWWWEENANEILDGLDKALLYEDDQDFIKENNLIVSSMGRHVQCVLNFENNEEEDGGTLIVPYFHRYLKTWSKVHEKQLRKPLPWVTLTKDLERQYLTYAHRVPMREGSVLIWDQRVLHGTAPNKSKRCRLAQYLKAFPRNLTYPLDGRIITEELKEKEEGILSQEDEISHPRLLRRSKAIYQRLALSNQIEHLSEIGHYLFGFDILSNR